jgi:hypothetical protein
VYYAEFLKVRRGLIGPVIAAVGIVLLNWYISWQFHAQSQDHVKGAPIPFFVVFAIGGLAASIYAIVIGGLADENGGHLPLAWSKPVSRSWYAVQVFAVDACAIVFIFALASAMSLAVFDAYGAASHFNYAGWIEQSVRFAVAPFAFFAITQASTASLDKPAGYTRGLILPAVFAVTILSIAQLPPAVHAILSALDYLNPIMWVAVESSDIGRTFGSYTATSLLGLSAISAIGLLGAVAQWRRLES